MTNWTKWIAKSSVICKKNFEFWRHFEKNSVYLASKLEVLVGEDEADVGVEDEILLSDFEFAINFSAQLRQKVANSRLRVGVTFFTPINCATDFSSEQIG